MLVEFGQDNARKFSNWVASNDRTGQEQTFIKLNVKTGKIDVSATLVLWGVISIFL